MRGWLCRGRRGRTREEFIMRVSGETFGLKSVVHATESGTCAPYARAELIDPTAPNRKAACGRVTHHALYNVTQACTLLGLRDVVLLVARFEVSDGFEPDRPMLGLTPRGVIDVALE